MQSIAPPPIDPTRAISEYQFAYGDLRRQLSLASTGERAMVRAFLELVRGAHRLDGGDGRHVRTLLENLGRDLERRYNVDH